MKAKIELITENKTEEKVIKKITKEFEDQTSMKQILKASDMAVALWDISQMLRTKTKYPPESMSEETLDAIHDIREAFFNILGEYNIDLDEI